MKCKRARKLLVRFDDAELGGETADELRRHLGHCRECSRQLDFLGRSLDAARNVDPAARLPGTPHPILPSREVYACRSVRLREMFLGISLLVRFRKRLAGLACICLLGLTAVVLCYRFRSSSEVQAVNASSKSDTATIRSESVSGALALID